MCSALPSGSEEVWTSEGGGSIKIFRRKKICLTVPKSLVRESLRVSLFSGAEENWIRKGVGSIKIFCRQFSVSSAESFRR